jgi:hypothetical protein
MKKFKGVFLPPAPSMESDNPRFSFKYLSLKQDYEQLKKETEAKKKKMETMRQKKSTLLAEVRFLRQRHQQLAQNQSLKPKPVQNFMQPLNPVTRKKNTPKGRNLRPPVPRFDMNRKGRIYNGKEPALQNLSLTFDLKQKQRTSKGIVSHNLFPVIEATTRSMTPVFDLNQISREVEEELQANCEPKRSEDMKRSLIRNGSDELQLNEMKLSACSRTVGNEPNRAQKRKISWQDQVALRV